MPFVLHHVVEVDAPPERVWEVIVDLPSYGEWNPFVVGAASTLEVGDPIEMKVKIFPFLTQRQRETIVEHESGKRLCYAVRGVPTGAIRSHRRHEVEALSPGRTRYTSHFELGGWLSPVVKLLLGGRLTIGFKGNTRGLKERAEALSRQSS